MRSRFSHCCLSDSVVRVKFRVQASLALLYPNVYRTWEETASSASTRSEETVGRGDIRRGHAARFGTLPPVTAAARDCGCPSAPGIPVNGGSVTACVECIRSQACTKRRLPSCTGGSQNDTAHGCWQLRSSWPSAKQAMPQAANAPAFHQQLIQYRGSAWKCSADQTFTSLCAVVVTDSLPEDLPWWWQQMAACWRAQSCAAGSSGPRPGQQYPPATLPACPLAAAALSPGSHQVRLMRAPPCNVQHNRTQRRVRVRVRYTALSVQQSCAHHVMHIPCRH